MTTFAIMFNTCTNSTWKMNWDFSQGLNVTPADITAVVDYIKNGKWAEDASETAKKCYDILSEHIADTIVEDAFTNSMATHVLMMYAKYYYDNNQLSPKSKLIYDRLASSPSISTTKKLLKKIVKNEKIYCLVIDDTRIWTDEELAPFKCCICGDAITDETGHNPYPVRDQSYYGERENRCCASCNQRFVIPARLRFGRSEANHRKLVKLDMDDLIGIVA